MARLRGSEKQAAFIRSTQRNGAVQPGCQDIYYEGTVIENHAYKLFLSIKGIEHTTITAYSTKINGMNERFHKTMVIKLHGAMTKEVYELSSNTRLRCMVISLQL